MDGGDGCKVVHKSMHVGMCIDAGRYVCACSAVVCVALCDVHVYACVFGCVSICIVCVYVCVYECVYVCVCEREGACVYV